MLMDKVQFAIVELMGHRRYGARVSTSQEFGAVLLRCEVLTDPPFEQIVSPASIFALTLCTEEQARAACNRWVIPAEIAPKTIPLELPATVEESDEYTDAPF